MKYIHKFESVEFLEEYNKYNFHDYVLLTADHGEYYVDVAEIVDKKKSPIQFYIKIPYRVNNGKSWFGWINYSEIERQITFKEYESIKNKNYLDYKIKKDAEKYNL